MHRRHPLRQRVAEWVRLPGVERIQLDPAPGRGRPGHGRADDQQPGEALGARYDEDIERIVQRSQGNAFYVEELVGAFLGGGWSLPEDLADLLLVRLDRLDESARDVVRVASAAGQRVSHDLLTAVAPVTRGRARGSRCERRSTRTCSCGPGDGGVRLPACPPRRGGVRRPAPRRTDAPAHGVRRSGARAPHGRQGAADLARHALASHDLPTALEASVDAGDQALAAGGPDEARTSLHEGAGDLRASAAYAARGPAGRGRARGPDRRRPVQRGPSRDGACSRSTPTSRDSPSDTPPVSKARLLLARVEALRSDREQRQRPSLVSAEALELVGPGGDPAPCADPGHARVGPGLRTTGSTRRANRSGRSPRARGPAPAATSRRRGRGDAHVAQPASRLRRGQLVPS